MTFLARFGSAQTGLGFQFYDATGALLGTRQTAGIVTLPEAGAYLVETTPPAGAAGIYWDSSTAEASEEIPAASGPTAAEITAAVLGATVPASYEDGTAGAALGRLAETPGEGPVLVTPDPAGSEDLVNVYVDTERITGEVIEGLAVTFQPASVPQVAPSGRLVATDPITRGTDSAGRLLIALEEGVAYLASCEALFGPDGLTFTPTGETYDLGAAATA